MQKISFCQTIDPATLGAQARAEFCQELYRLHCQIFDGVDAAEFESKVFNPHARWTKIRVFKNAKGDPVGYCALHTFEKTINSEALTVFRVETGLVRDYRRQGNVFPFLLKESIKSKVLHPFNKAYFFCTLVHPSSFHLISKFFWVSYPNVNYATPPDVLEKMDKIADAFHEVRLPDGDPSVRKVGWITRQTMMEEEDWATTSNPGTRLFLQKNPGYQKGQGLMTLVPLSFANLLLTSLFLAYFRMTRLVQRILNKT